MREGERDGVRVRKRRSEGAKGMHGKEEEGDGGRGGERMSAGKG